MSTIGKVRDRFPELPIAVGGQAFRWGGTERLSRFEGVRHVSSLNQLEELIKND